MNTNSIPNPLFEIIINQIALDILTYGYGHTVTKYAEERLPVGFKIVRSRRHCHRHSGGDNIWIAPVINTAFAGGFKLRIGEIFYQEIFLSLWLSIFVFIQNQSVQVIKLPLFQKNMCRSWKDDQSVCFSFQQLKLIMR